MTHAFRGSLEGGLDLLHPELVDHQRLALLKQAARRLPPTCSSLLECRLGANQNQIDLSQSFLREDRKLLNDLLADLGLNQDAWGRIQALAREWSVPGSRIERELTNIWLEFDLAEQSTPELTTPAPFLSFDRTRFASLSDPSLEESLRYYFRALLGREQHPDYLSAFLACLARLPEGATPNYLGFMISREPVTVRGLFRGLDPRETQSYLAEIGLTRKPESLRDGLDLATEHFSSFVLCIDLRPDISPRVGLELFPVRDEPDTSCETFLDHLVAVGLCTRQKRDAVLGWPATADPSDCESWPEALIIDSLRRGSRWLSLMNRRINHFKLTCEPGRPIEAKAYLAHDLWSTFDDDDDQPASRE